MNEELEKLADALTDQSNAWRNRWASLQHDALPDGKYPDMASIDTQAKIANAAFTDGLAAAYHQAAVMARSLISK